MTATARDIELDTGPRASERERLCVATRTVRPVSELIRFVIGPDGAPVADLKRKLPGRGIWVTATNGALGEAIKRKAFSRGFKREIRLPPDLVARTEQMLARAVVDALAIAGKAGLVAAGFARRPRRWSRRRSPPSCMQRKPRRMGCASSTRSCAGGSLLERRLSSVF